MPSEDGTRWAVSQGDALAWRSWDDSFLVYNTVSGQTHHLNLLAGEALLSLEAEAAELSELISRLANQFGIAQDSQPLQMIDSLIHELDELGLITPSTP